MELNDSGKAVMIPAKISLEQSHIDLLSQYKELGFRDESSVVRSALDLLMQQRLEESADLYAEIYEQDLELQQLTNAAIAEWPA